MDAYIALKLTWWLLLGVLLAAVLVMVGMDMGVGAALRYLGRTDLERRTVLNIIGPHWGGNQVWFVLGGGAVFAAWPLLYATAFSGLYIVMLVLLWAMIVRPLGFEYRNMMAGARWRGTWDWMLFISGAVPMVVFGAAIGNMLHGVPFHYEPNMVSHYTGSFIALFNPFAILCGLLALALALYQGGVMVAGRSAGTIHQRAVRQASSAGSIALALFAVGGIWVARMPGYVVTGGLDPAGPAAPLRKTVIMHSGAWLANFADHPLLWGIPALVFVALTAGILAVRAGAATLAWWLGALAGAATIATVGAAMFPFLMPSSSQPDASLTVWDASSSARTLAWMLVFTLVFIPIIVTYTSWAFHVMRGKVLTEDIENREDAY